MATAIRLRRGGRTHHPCYRVVVVDSRDRSRGNVLDTIGIYNPCARPEPELKIDRTKALRWLSQGARPSDTVNSLLRKQGIKAAFAAGEQAEDASAAETPAAAEVES